MKWIKITDKKPEEEGIYLIKIIKTGLPAQSFFAAIPASTEIKWAYWSWIKSKIIEITTEKITYAIEWGFFDSKTDSDLIRDVYEWMPLPKEKDE